jgi:uncharacterized protein YndB with AHSA1/START domain
MAQDTVISRVFDAPREQVWRAWTDCEGIKQWWGPKGFTSPTCRIDLRVGGTYLLSMRDPEGHDYFNTGTYREVVAPERFVATDDFADENGNIVPPSYYGMTGDTPANWEMSVTLEEVEGKTRVTVRHTGFGSAQDRRDAESGWNESLDKLENALRSLSVGAGGSS